MDAFVDFHYVVHGSRAKRFFINEIHVITFDPQTASIISSKNTTFNNPSLRLNSKCESTFRYGYEHCHGMALYEGKQPYTAIRDSVKELDSCTNIFVRGSVKQRILSRLIRGGGTVYNVTTLISEILGRGAVGNRTNPNLPGYVTYAYMRSIYNSDSCCDVHKNIKNGATMCISNQCNIAFSWFVDNYYWLVKAHIGRV